MICVLLAVLGFTSVFLQRHGQIYIFPMLTVITSALLDEILIVWSTLKSQNQPSIHPTSI